MSPKELAYVKTLFFEGFKIIKNMHTMEHWFGVCQYYSGCCSLENFLRLKKRYCCICQFQDRFNLWGLNEIKRDLPKLKKYYSEIMKEVCEIKKVIASKESFWEREIYYIIRSDGVFIFFNKAKKIISVIEMDEYLQKIKVF